MSYLCGIKYIMNFIFRCLFLMSVVFLSSCSHKEISVMPELTVKNHSFSNFDSVKLKHIHLDLEVDFKSKKLEGKVVLTIENTFSCNYLILDTRQLVIEKVLLEDSSETAWSMGEERQFLGSALVIQIAKNTRNVAVYYKTSKDADAIMWLDPSQTSGKKHPFMFTQSQAILARTWIPCMDVPAVRSTYTAKIKCDKQYLALMSAENPTEKSSDGTYTFKMTEAVPSYLMALAVGDIRFKSLGSNCGVYAEPDMLTKSAEEFTLLPSMIAAASKMYGEYAWGRYDILVLPPSFPFGGMENPRLTFATPTIIAGDKSLVSLVAHELAHSWSGNLVTNKTWEDFWLNEGFTVYFEQRIMEEIYGKDYADMLAVISKGELDATIEDFMISAPGDTKLKLNMKGRNPDEGVSDIAYVKGFMFLKLLEEKFGRKSWDAFLNGYFNTFKWKTIDTEEFLVYLDENLLQKNKNIEVNIKEWVYEIGLPENCPKITSTQFEKVERMADQININKDIKVLDTTGFTTHHWLHLLRNLEADSIKDIMKQIDTAYQLSASRNSEIQCDWYILCIRNNYLYADQYLENYLMSVGRRKFLKPLYEELSLTTEGLEKGRIIYSKAESSYHAVSRNTIREILKLDDHKE